MGQGLGVMGCKERRSVERQAMDNKRKVESNEWQGIKIRLKTKILQGLFPEQSEKRRVQGPRPTDSFLVTRCFFHIVNPSGFWYETRNDSPSGRKGGCNYVKIEGCEKRQQKETGQIPQREKRSQEVEKTGKSIKTGYRQWVIGDGTGAISGKQ